MSTVTVLDDYLADLMVPKPAPAATAVPAAPAPVQEPAPAPVTVQEPPPAAPAPAADPDAIGDDEFEALLDALHGKGGAPQGPVAADEPPPAAAPVPVPVPAGDMIGDDEFEALLDALHGKGGAPQGPVEEPAVAAPAPAAPPAPCDVPALVADGGVASSPFVQMGQDAARHPVEGDRRRRASDRVTAWLRFALGEQHFAVEVLKVQEVLRVPEILPLRGAAPAMIGLMNLRGQIVPVLDLAVRLGMARQVPDEASRVIVLEEGGDTLGLLVRAVADVVGLTDAAIEHLGGALAMDGADVMCGIARRERSVTVLLDAHGLLAA